MCANRFHGAVSGFLGKAQLMKLRLKAMRAGVWFTLAQNILAVVRKLECVMESRFVRAVREVGFPVARRLGLIAQRLGNDAGRDWGSDRGFACYLAAMSLNEPHLFRG
jgi:hypothetical protein